MSAAIIVPMMWLAMKNPLKDTGALKKSLFWIGYMVSTAVVGSGILVLGIVDIQYIHWNLPEYIGISGVFTLIIGLGIGVSFAFRYWLESMFPRKGHVAG